MESKIQRNEYECEAFFVVALFSEPQSGLQLIDEKE